MSLELVKEAIKVNQVVGEQLTQTVIENDIIVPDIKPDVARILLLDGDALVKNAETAQDKVTIYGTLCYKILYVSDDEDKSIKSINSNANFAYDLDVPSARSNMKCNVKCDIEHIDYTILNGRKINAKAIVKVYGKVVEAVDRNIVYDLEGDGEIQSIRDRVSVNCSLGEGEMEHVVRESMDVPAGKPTMREVLRNDIKIAGKDFKLTDNKVIAKGELIVSTLYISDDENQGIQYMEHEIPFNAMLDLPGITEDAGCDLALRVMDSQFEPSEDSDGELRVLNGEISLKITASGYARKTVEVISDAYSPKARLVLDREPFRFEEITSENKSQIMLKDTIALSEDSPEIAEILNVLCKPSLSECKVYDNRITLEGAVGNNILYLSGNPELPISCSKQDVLFRHGLDIKGINPDMSCDVDLDVEHCNYSMVSSNEVEIRLVIGVSTKVVNQFALPLIVRATEQPIDDKRAEMRPSILIYFTQPGDTLWKIAKKYYVALNDIKKVNNMENEEPILPGQQIIIPGKRG